MIEILKAFGQALLTGALAGFMGYMKMEELGTSWSVIFTKEFWSRFEPTKALKTVLVSLIVYGVSFALGHTPQSIEEIGVYTLIVYGVDALIKVIVRRTPIVKVWNALKEKAQAIFGK